MEYPGARFRRPIRITMLVLFIVAFFIISPVVIIYSAGYRFDFRNGLLRETGSLSVDIHPKDASVYLDGLKIDQSIPVRLNNLTPHKYTLRLSLPGYYDWEKQIEINKNQTTYIKGLTLLKKDHPIKILKETAKNISLSSEGRYLAYLSGEKNSTILKLSDLISNSTKNILTLPAGNSVGLSWSPSGDILALFSASAPHNIFYIVTTPAAPKIYNLIDKEKSEIIKFIWSRDIEAKLYFGTTDKIYSFMPKLGEAGKISSSTFQDWYLEDGSLWTIDYITNSRRLAISSDALGFKNNFAFVPETENETSSSLKGMKLVSAKKNTVVLANADGNKFYIVKKDKYFTVNGNKMFYSKFDNWMILWNPYELWTYSEGDDPLLLNRSGEVLKDVLPIDENNTLAMLWNDEITALHPYFYTDRSLVTGKIFSMTANQDQRILYYSDENGIWKLNY